MPYCINLIVDTMSFSQDELNMSLDDLISRRREESIRKESNRNKFKRNTMIRKKCYEAV